MPTLTWLHLSDLHACHPRHGWDAGRVTETLVEDLRRLQGEHGLRPDLIFFSGDAAFGQIGTKPGETITDQLAKFACFLEAVRTAYEPEIALENVFLVPGNHDVNREWATPDQTEWLDRQESIDPVRAMVQAGGVQWWRYMDRLADYRAFLESHGGFDHLLDDPERLIYSTVREVGGLRVGIAGFNSAWSCCRKGERGKLWMAGRWQQGVLRPRLKDCHFAIALTHHPPDWLVEYEAFEFGRRIEQDFRFLLHGHDHRAWVQATDDYTVIAAGACYEHSESRHNGYNLVRLEAESGLGEVWLRSFDSDGGGWVPRLMARGKTDGRGVWKLPLDWLGSRGKQGAGSPVEVRELSTETADDEELTDLDRYQQRLRAKNSDLPIIGFETRIRMPIRIDQVYMPLRARLSVAQPGRMGAGPTAGLEELEGAGRRLLEEPDREVDLDEVFRLVAAQGRRGAVILGAPGSGKTTLLKHFVLAALDPVIGPTAFGLPAATIPVLIELRRLRDPGAGLRAAVEDAISLLELELDAAIFADVLLDCRQRLLVLIDGLDEVAEESTRVAVSRWVETALEEWPRNTYVLTSRPAGYRGEARLDDTVLELEIREVEEEQARTFIASWYEAVESQAKLGRPAEETEEIARRQAADLVARIFESEDPRVSNLCDLAENPLMLQILCLVHRDQKSLPEERVELYQRSISVLLELWRRIKEMPVELGEREALRLLRPLAWHLHVAETRQARLDEILPYLVEPLHELGRPPETGARLLAAIHDQSGVLVSLGPSLYGFLHLSFQEYLAALHVQDRLVAEPELLRQLAGHFGETWWREVILLAFGLDSPSLFHPLMAEILELGALHRDAALANFCLRDALVSSPRPFLAALAAGIGDDEERYHALRLLKGIAGWESAEIDGVCGREIVEGLVREEKYRQARSMAVELLGGEPAVVEEPEAPAVIVPGERERVHEKDGSVLVYVPGGVFTLGAEDIDIPELDEEWRKKYREWPQPVHKVELSPFWIGKYPVTNAQYRRFLEANSGQAKPEYWDDKQFNEPEQPVVGVSWLDAMAYCRWAGLALTSEAQWEAAARGTDGRAYPWGNEEPNRELANFAHNEGRPTPVGAFPKGAGPYGTLDQAGNVWEWCRDGFDENAYSERDGQRDPFVPGEGESAESALRVVRGGSWGYESRNLRAAIRSWLRAGGRVDFLGFRVSRSVPEHGN